MQQKLELLIKDFLKKLPYYWPGFEVVAYAFYDKKDVYLYNHPRQGVLQWNNEFVGDTIILFEDVPTAIVNLDLHVTDDDLYSILCHELFHGYQFLKGEKRFPDELLGIAYPLVKENIELRNLERKNLHQAVMEETFPKKQEYLLNFISLREKRKSYIEEFLPYETHIETVEGPAWYVELKAFAEKSSRSIDEVLHKYGNGLMDQSDSTLNLRKSCLSSGLFICLLLDELLPHWKEKFLDSDITLYETLKQAADVKISPIKDIAVSQETEEIFNLVQKEREKDFIAFDQSEGYHLTIEGEIKAAGIDPMNIVKSGNKLLHKRFLKIGIQEDEFLIQQPVAAEFKERFRDIHRLHLVLNEKPVEKAGFLHVTGVGNLKGKFIENEQTLWLK